MQDIIERAERVARELTNFKRYGKAKDELYRLQNGKGSLVLELLQVEPRQIDQALVRADQETERSYTLLTSLVQGREV